LGRFAWKLRLKRYSIKKLKKQLSVAGKIAARKGVSGRSRLPDDQVKPNTLYQREGVKRFEDAA
jgi:hypothetical protein